MATAYCDFEAGSDSNDGSTWTLAELTLQAAITTAGAGGVVYVRRTNAGTPTKDTAAASRTLTIPASTITNPVTIIGCKDGTTAEPPTSSDICVRGTDNLPHFEVTGGGNDLTWAGATTHSTFIGIEFTSQDRFQSAAVNVNIVFKDCIIHWVGLFFLDTRTLWRCYNCDLDTTNTGANILLRGSARIEQYGGLWSYSANASTLVSSNTSEGSAYFFGVNFSAYGGAGLTLCSNQSNDHPVEFVHCKMPTTYTVSGSDSSQSIHAYVKAIGVSNAASHTNTDSVQDFEYSDPFGDVDIEVTDVRTNGADDQATGAFSYAMAPNASATLEGSSAALVSPWMRVWVAGGSAVTLTVFITNGTADLNEDDIWCEFYFPDSDDSSLHEQVVDPTVAEHSAIGSSTIITDDTASTWATSNTHKQKFTITDTPGWTGWASARVHYAKASGQTVYVDPRIIIT